MLVMLPVMSKPSLRYRDKWKPRGAIEKGQDIPVPHLLVWHTPNSTKPIRWSL